ncbi:MAG: beta-N-acetylhexosaminidase [bacterium]
MKNIDNKPRLQNIIIFILILFSFGATLFIIGCSRESKLSGDVAASRIHVIPKPAFVQEKRGEFEITSDFRIVVDQENDEIQTICEYFTEKLNKAAGIPIPIHTIKADNKTKGALTLHLTDQNKALGKEGYTLKIDRGRMTLEAEAPAGLFYGIQTLFQLLPAEIESESRVEKNIRWILPCSEIRDVPRYPYRGMHLDVGRHFFPKSFIKRYIDLLALHKFNTFHWHLTEDQGWRIEIKKYPKLTQVGSYRKESLIGHASDRPHRFDGKRYGGYYTQEDVKEIVAYAQNRYITIIPEIEMPGHSQAALAAYPELSCTGGPFEVGTLWGVYKDVYCAGNDRVFEFLEDVLTELIDLFPSTYIHIGGDECPKDRWKKCPKCQARIREEGLKDEHELQSYFIRRIEKFLISKGRRLIGWDEILEGGLAPEATVMSWRGTEGGIEAAKQGHDVIMTPTSHCYFDYYQANPETEPLAIGGHLTLKKVYAFEPTPEELSPEEQKYILGAQGNVWTEYIQTPESAEYMSIPRMCALAEVVWSPKEVRDWDDFRTRLGAHSKRLDAMEVNYCKSSSKD